MTENPYYESEDTITNIDSVIDLENAIPNATIIQRSENIYYGEI